MAEPPLTNPFTPRRLTSRGFFRYCLVLPDIVTLRQQYARDIMPNIIGLVPEDNFKEDLMTKAHLDTPAVRFPPIKRKAKEKHMYIPFVCRS